MIKKKIKDLTVAELMWICRSYDLCEDGCPLAEIFCDYEFYVNELFSRQNFNKEIEINAYT